MRLAALLILLCACRPTHLEPVSQCGTPCWPQDAGFLAPCSPGHWDCGDDGGMTCVDAVLPQAEVCDGVDNDCDGFIDNHIPDDPHLCQNRCGPGYVQCLNGAWTQCSAPQPQQEVCNGRDDDCNGVVDDNLPTTYCYDGPAGTAGSGLCHPGSMRCASGVESCFGEQVPTPEVCNGLDDDCNGLIDDGISCNLAKDLKVVLTWEPESDIDIHVRNTTLATGNAHDWTGWDDSVLPFDCFYANMDPIWSMTRPQENPHQDVDDLYGPGPEDTTITQMNAVDIYSVGVHVYTWRSYPAPVTATVNIYCGGLLVASRNHLIQDNNFWVVGTVQHTSSAICVFIDDGTIF